MFKIDCDMAWRSIPGWPGYFICPCGAVISEKSGHPKALKPIRRGRMGHRAVNLLIRGIKTMKTISVHRLVADAFLPAPRAGQVLIMHLDDDPANNAAVNLAWGTPAENSAQMTARNRQAVGERVAGAKLTADAVVEMRRLHGEEGISTRRLAARFSIARSSAQSIISGKNWRHI